MKLAFYNFNKQELAAAKQRLLNGSPCVEGEFHPEDDAKSEREILAECSVMETEINNLARSFK